MSLLRQSCTSLAITSGVAIILFFIFGIPSPQQSLHHIGLGALVPWLAHGPGLPDLVAHCGLREAEPAGETGPSQWILHRDCRLASPSLGSYDTIIAQARRCVTYTARYNGTSTTGNTLQTEQSYTHAALETTQGRTAIVIRAWDGFNWTTDDIQHIRTMIHDLSSLSDQYSIHILLHDRSSLITRQSTTEAIEVFKIEHVPSEFLSITEVWSYQDCQDAYPLVGEYDFYYHAFMALQLFADRHPEYDHFWNWEADVRYTGNYADLFPAIAKWSSSQPKDRLWSQNDRFYVPGVSPPLNDPSTYHERPTNELPRPTPWIKDVPMLASTKSAEADFITPFPMFQTTETVWPHRDYLVHYHSVEIQPRFGTVSTNTRLSRRMLQCKSHENKAGRAMMSEMWPPTLAYHHDLKAVFVPHRVIFNNHLSASAVDAMVNAGKDGRVEGSKDSIINHEDRFLESTWFWNAKIASQLYQLWMGTGAEAEAWSKAHGPLCLPGMLLHPVKSENLIP